MSFLPDATSGFPAALSALKSQAKSTAEQFTEQLEVLKAARQTDELIKQAAAQAGARVKVAPAADQNAAAALRYPI